jgi:hypothetical protein
VAGSQSPTAAAAAPGTPTAAQAQQPVLRGNRVLVRLDPSNKPSRILRPAAPGREALSPTSDIQVTYTGSWAPQAQAAFEASVQIWERLLVSSVPILVDARWEPLGQNILGSAGPTALYPSGSTYYSVALFEAMTGVNQNGTAFDIEVSINSAYSAWYFGTDGNTPSNLTDLMTIALHELTHGLGSIDTFVWNDGSGSFGLGPSGWPARYDQFVVNASLQLLTSFTNPSAALGAQLLSRQLFWNGTMGRRANGGHRPRLYAPNPYALGSSVAHLDEDTYPARSPNSLMTPFIAWQEAVHDPGPILLGMFKDMGWGIAGGGGCALSNSAYDVAWTAHTVPSSMAGAANVSVNFCNAGSEGWEPGGAASAVKVTYRWRNSGCGGVVLESGASLQLSATVQPGVVVSNFPVNVVPPVTGGAYCLEFDLVRNGITFSSQGSSTLRVNVSVTASNPYNVSWGADTAPATMVAGTSANVTLSFTNTGSATWLSGGSSTAVKLTYRWRNSNCSSVVKESGTLWWLGANVPAGATVSNYAMSITAPAGNGTYCLEFDLTRAGVTFSSQGRPTLRTTINVGAQSNVNVSWGPYMVPGTLATGATANVTLTFTNTGSTTWLSGGSAAAVKVTYRWRNSSCSSVVKESGTLWWLGANVPAGAAVSNYPMQITAPSSSGTYCLEFDLTQNGVTFSSLGRPALRVTLDVGSQSAYNVSWGAHTTPANMSAGQSTSLTLSFSNTGSAVWLSGGSPGAVKLTYRWRSSDCSSVVVESGTLWWLGADVPSGAGVSNYPMSVVPPALAGSYCLEFDLTQSGVTFSSMAKPALRLSVIVGPAGNANPG